MYASSRRLQWRLTLVVMVVFALLSSGCSPFPSQPATLTPTQRVTESPPVVSPTPVPATAPPVTPTPLAALTDPASLINKLKDKTVIFTLLEDVDGLTGK